ncbi:MAG: hypothetical protein ACRCXL_13735, partial [Dermatophilaceae bacterium]
MPTTVQQGGWSRSVIVSDRQGATSWTDLSTGQKSGSLPGLLRSVGAPDPDGLVEIRLGDDLSGAVTAVALMIDNRDSPARDRPMSATRDRVLEVVQTTRSPHVPRGRPAQRLEAVLRGNPDAAVALVEVLQNGTRQFAVGVRGLDGPMRWVSTGYGLGESATLYGIPYVTPPQDADTDLVAWVFDSAGNEIGVVDSSAGSARAHADLVERRAVILAELPALEHRVRALGEEATSDDWPDPDRHVGEDGSVPAVVDPGHVDAARAAELEEAHVRLAEATGELDMLTAVDDGLAAFPPQEPDTARAIERGLRSLVRQRVRLEREAYRSRLLRDELSRMTPEDYRRRRGRDDDSASTAGPASLAGGDLAAAVKQATARVAHLEAQVVDAVTAEAAGHRASRYGTVEHTSMSWESWHRMRPPETRDAVSESEEAERNLRERVSDPNGRPMRHVSPDRWVRLVNPRGPSVADNGSRPALGDPRGARRGNDIDSALSSLATWFGFPTVAGIRATPLVGVAPSTTQPMWDQRAERFLSTVGNWLTATSAGEWLAIDAELDLMRAGPGAAVSVLTRNIAGVSRVLLAFNLENRLPVWVDPQAGTVLRKMPDIDVCEVRYSVFDPAGARLDVVGGQLPEADGPSRIRGAG